MIKKQLIEFMETANDNAEVLIMKPNKFGDPHEDCVYDVEIQIVNGKEEIIIS